MTLHLYFARRFTKWFLIVLAVFLLMFLLTDSAQIGGRLPDSTAFSEVMGLTLLKSPAGVYKLLPLVVAIAALAMFLGLARSSELVVTRAAGRSALGALAAPVTAAVLVGLAATAVFNPIIASSLGQFEKASRKLTDGSFSAFSLSRSGLWLRQGDASGQWVIFAERANFDATRLFGVMFIELNPEGNALRRIEAESAFLEPGSWTVRSGKVWQLSDNSVVPEKAATEFDNLTISSTLTSEQILDSFGEPETVSFWDLPGFATRLDNSGISSTRHRVHFQFELAQPLMLAAMVLIVAGFTMRPTRFGGTGMMVLSAILASFAVFFLRNFSQIMGVNGDIPVVMSAWSPPIAAFLLAVGLLLHREDG